MSLPPRAGFLTHYPMSDWSQVEDPAEVAAVEARLAALPRLAVYAHPELYELAYPGFPGDGEFYTQQAANGDVLYLGVGTGRIFAEMVRANPRALGLDNSPAMLETLRRRYPAIPADRLLLGSSADVELPAESFDVVVAPFCFLEVLNAADRERTLHNIARWLRPGGRFLTDTFSPFLIPFRRPGLETLAFHPHPDVRVEFFIRYDHCRQAMTEAAVVTLEGKSQVTWMGLHYAFPHELTQAFVRAGLEEPGISGGYDGRPFLPAACDMIVYQSRRLPG